MRELTHQASLLLTAAVIAAGTAFAAEPSKPSAADGEAIVLLTPKPKDPFAPTAQPVGFVKQALSEQEARRLMRRQWQGPAPVHQAEAAMHLAVWKWPLMTRRKFVEAILDSYEKAAGAKRSDIRIDVLSDGAPAPSSPPQTAAPAAADRPVAAAPSRSGSSSGQADCVTLRSAPEVARIHVRNNCDGTVAFLTKRRDRADEICLPSSVRPGDEMEISDRSNVYAVCRFEAGLPKPDDSLFGSGSCRCGTNWASISAGEFPNRSAP